MKGAIAGMGLTLSAAILATSASAAQHPNGTVSASDITQRAVNEFVESYASHDSVGLARTTTGDFRIPGDPGSDRIALLELRGNRVARIHNLAGPVPHYSTQVAAAEHPAQ
jgi:hypothetical protein